MAKKLSKSIRIENLEADLALANWQIDSLNHRVSLLQQDLKRLTHQIALDNDAVYFEEY